MALIDCDFCGQPVNTHSLGVYRKIIGWAERRKQGGSNSITLSSEALGWAHGSCVEQEKKRKNADIDWGLGDNQTGSNCNYCTKPVDTHALGVYRRVIGWAQMRKQGGSNSISLSSEPLAWAHGPCVDQEKSGGSVSWNQDNLFE